MIKAIFKRIEKRDWDWFGYSHAKDAFDYYFKEEYGVLKMIIESGRIEIKPGLTQSWAGIEYSLSDFLSNKSWCTAVWGESQPLTTNDDEPWNGQECLHCKTDVRYQPSKEIYNETGCLHGHYPEACNVCWRRSKGYKYFSEKAFVKLQQEGQDSCLKYIKKTMV